MTKKITGQIKDKAFELLKNNPDGLRYSELVRLIKEDDFYEPFSAWLQNEIEDVTHAISLGGNRFKGKWGTPDVIGKKESKRSDIIQSPVEIVSAEIKTDTNQLITAFGQVCAYKLFSHKCFGITK